MTEKEKTVEFNPETSSIIVKTKYSYNNPIIKEGTENELVFPTTVSESVYTVEEFKKKYPLEYQSLESGSQKCKLDTNGNIIVEKEIINVRNLVFEQALSKYNISDDSRALLNFYIKRSLENALGRIEFDSTEIDVMLTREGVVIHNIFDEPLNIYFIRNQAGPVIKGIVNENDLFTITIHNASMSNTIYKEVETGIEKSVYRVETKSNEFTLSKGIVEDKKTLSEDLDVIIKLSPYNAKFKATEMFELTVVKPKAEKSDSFLKRLVDNLRSDSFVKIETSEELCDVKDYSETVFGRLESEYKKIQNSKLLEKK